MKFIRFLIITITLPLFFPICLLITYFMESDKLVIDSTKTPEN